MRYAYHEYDMGVLVSFARGEAADGAGTLLGRAYRQGGIFKDADLPPVPVLGPLPLRLQPYAGFIPARSSPLFSTIAPSTTMAHSRRAISFARTRTTATTCFRGMTRTGMGEMNWCWKTRSPFRAIRRTGTTRRRRLSHRS